MESQQLDLGACENEPIRIPGTIQPHGWLVVIDPSDLRILQASQNVHEIFGFEAEHVLGSPLTTFLVESSSRRLREALSVEDSLSSVNPVPLTTAEDTHQLDAILHRLADRVIIEFECRDDELSLATSFHRIRQANIRLNGAADFSEFTHGLAEEVRALTGFDRVMVYRFDRQWHGEVIAEDRRSDLEPFLSLRFPASDIPPQARELYTTNWLRIIPTARYEPVPLVPPFLDGQPLNLSESVLRSVSPVHLQYLRNMGVAASMSISLVHEGALWGMVACHHYSGPRRLSYGIRAAAEFLGQAASLLIPVKAAQDERHDASAVKSMLTQLHREITSSDRDIVTALTHSQPTVAEVVGASGVVVYVDGVMTTLGSVPSTDEVLNIARWIRARDLWPLSTDSLGRENAVFSALREVVSGVMAIELAAQSSAWIMWFRPEVITTVTWAGDPNEKTTTVDASGVPVLAPRVSFARWQQEQRGVALEWKSYEEDAAKDIGRAVTNRLLLQNQGTMDAARELQESLVSVDLPSVRGLTTAFRYVASDGTPIGGDWYDAVALPSGELALSLGDVAGHGIPAAATMAQLRNSLRAYLVDVNSPSVALSNLNALVHMLLPSEMATGVVARLSADRRRVRVASAGHLPVLLIRAGQAELVAPPRAPALGVLEGAQYNELEIELLPGDAFMFYTDGLIEGRSRPLDAGFAALRRTAESVGTAGDLEHFCDELIANVRARGADDDVALLVVRIDS
jgi:chemotaxis family two-component system sensor kinase Cph1